MKTEVMLEVVPPSRMFSSKYYEKVLGKLVEAINSIKKIDFVNVPEIIDENRLGKPFYRNVSIREFGKRLEDLTGKQAIVNKVVVHLNGMQGFDEWINRSINQFNIKSFVFVGGAFEINYSGPKVIEANKKAKAIPGVKVGNIMIPSRKNEVQRMLEKTLSGADFFTTQILFSAEDTKKDLLEYDRLCKEQKIKSAKIFLSFCPVSSKGELDFLKWLEVKIPAETEKKLRGENPVKASISAVQKLWIEFNEFKKENNLSVSLALNIEEIFLHNLAHCIELASSLQET